MSCHAAEIFAQTVTAQVITAFPTENFNYDGQSAPYYGLKWANDSWQPVGPTAWLGSYGGMKFFTSGQRRFSIHANGTLEMSAPLIMTPTAAASNYIQFKNNGTNIGIIGSDAAITGNDATNFGIYVYGGKDLEFTTGVSKRMVIKGNGNIGIGTTTPTEKLSVKGKIRAQELKIEADNSTNWPDYVFQPAYQLTPLPELERFIKANRHLPEIPSAKEVTANGIEVGANQALLLKKIEEMTLHLIQMEKRISQQDKEIEYLKNKIKI
ncbi:hypothetical protein GCM10027516_38000 [Niabella aquatica]